MFSSVCSSRFTPAVIARAPIGVQQIAPKREKIGKHTDTPSSSTHPRASHTMLSTDTSRDGGIPKNAAEINK
jgi:hypothetical protein